MTIDPNYEIRIKNKFGYYNIAGVDEVGRGPLAGPVTAGAFIFLKNIKDILNKDEAKYIRDSKQLSEKQREDLFKYFSKLKKEGMVDFTTASVFPSTIDKKSIHHAVVLAMRRAVRKLNPTPDYAIVDGFRYPRDILTQFEYASVKKADAWVPTVAAASIVAKVKRDRSMAGYYNKKYPEYRFDLHKGYGTKLHYEKIKEFGPSPIHRKSFRLM